MDEKIMEMLVQLMQSQTEIRSELKELKSGQLKELKSGQELLSQQMIDMENSMSEKLGALLDFRQMQKEHNQKTDETLERLERKIEVLQLETSSIRRVK